MPGRCSPGERARARDVRGDRRDREVLVDQRLQVGAAARDEDADHDASAQTTPSIALLELPDHGEAGPLSGVRGRHDRAEADAEVEDAALLVLGDAALVQPGEDRRAAPSSSGSIRAPSPPGRTRGRFPGMPPPVTWASARTSQAARRRRTSSR